MDHGFGPAELGRAHLSPEVLAAPERDVQTQLLVQEHLANGLDAEVTEDAQAEPVFTAGALLAAQTLLRRMPVGDAVVEMILDLVRRCRPDDPTAPDFVTETVAWGPGPRAAQALMLLVRARALLDGRLAPSADDVHALAHPVLVLSLIHI